MSHTPDGSSDLLSAERLKMFTDAVVAIAMTLLILPLMDSVGEAASANLSAAEWFVEERGSLLGFALSFLLIANFWQSHHRLFVRIERITNALLWLTVAWMFSIVWLPVATAVLSSLPQDAAQVLIYVGSLWVASLLTLATIIYVIRHPELHSIPPQQQRRTLAADIAITTMFLVALVVTLLLPVINYWSMLLLFLAPVLGRGINAAMNRRRPLG
jgi:uncharacterized membrane protein